MSVQTQIVNITVTLQMPRQIFHFSRISGMKKKCNDGPFDFWPEHYRYHGEPFKIHPQSTVLIVLCNNCDEEHVCHYNNCELVCDAENNILTIYLRNVHIHQHIWIHNRQTIGTLYNIHPEVMYGHGAYVTEQYFFTHVIQNKKIDPRVKKLCILTSHENPTIEIYWNTKNHMLTKLACGWNFFCICHPFGENRFHFRTNSKYVILSMSCRKSNMQYYILCKKTMPLSLFYLSLSSLIQNNLNHYLNFLPKVVRENIPTCHLQHLLPWGKKYYNQNCLGNGPFSSSIIDW